MIELADVRQTTDYSCGQAATAAVCRYYSRPAPAVDWANPVQGVCPATLEAYLRQVGLNVLSGTMGVADLKHLTKTGRPVLCPTAWHGGHWVVVTRVHRGRVHYQCPLEGPSSTRILNFEAAWSDTSRDGHRYRRWGICPSSG